MSRNKDTRALAKFIGQATGNGKELAMILLAMARDEGAEDRDRRAAIELLFERFVGKAPVVIDVEVTQLQGGLDVTRLTDDELRALEGALAKIATDAPPQLPSGPVLEAEIVGEE